MDEPPKTSYQFAAAVWSVAWTVGGVLTLILSSITDLSLARQVAPASVLVGTVMVGVPTYVGAKAFRSRHPILESVVWVAWFAVIATWLVLSSAPPILNINTTETMRARAERGRTVHLPEEAIRFLWGVVFYGVAAGSGSVLCTTDRRRWDTASFNAIVFSAIVAGSLVAAVVVGIVSAGIIFLAAPVLAGGVAGLGITGGRVLSRRLNHARFAAD